MQILAGILFYATVLASFVAFFSESSFIIHLGKLIIGVIAIVILFSIGVPGWICALAIASVAVGFIGMCLATADMILVGGFMVIAGTVGNAVIGSLLIFAI
ncbi:MAG: hypothetical protein IJY43_06770 [Clostridia bacterium]|nr:hypothetical protein [Clostridia bacterium]